jgi:adenylosuccinate lyase
MNQFDGYQSPFSWRYGSPEMRTIWSERSKHLIWRKIWSALAKTQVKWNLVSREQVDDLAAHLNNVDLEAAIEYEKQIQHDLMAEIKVYASQCTVGGGIIHLGATSMDIKDNAEVMQQKQALEIVLLQLRPLLEKLAEKMEKYAGLPVIGFTHLQPAEPTTLGYRLANYAQDFLEDYQMIQDLHSNLKGKGFKGTVGNAASYQMLYGADSFEEFEQGMSTELELPFFEAATQTYTRKQDLKLVNVLASAAATAYKFAQDLRLLQSEVIGELAEPFGEHQVGSSAMPFKRNPIHSEKIDSLARSISAYPNIAWDNYALSTLERTLDDSANRRSMIPELFLGLDEILITLNTIVDGLQVRETTIKRNLSLYGPFSAVEKVLLACVKQGADRQQMHEILRKHSMTAWEKIQMGELNPLLELVQNNSEITLYINQEDLIELFDVMQYTGIAKERTIVLARGIKQLLTGFISN